MKCLGNKHGNTIKQTYHLQGHKQYHEERNLVEKCVPKQLKYQDAFAEYL